MTEPDLTFESEEPSIGGEKIVRASNEKNVFVYRTETMMHVYVFHKDKYFAKFPIEFAERIVKCMSDILIEDQPCSK